MKTKRVPWAILVLFAAGLLASCAGQAARENVLLPAMRMAWPEVRADVDVGAPLLGLDGSGANLTAIALREADELGAALGAEDAIAAAAGVEWPFVETAALAGIDERVRLGRLGQGGKENRVEQVRQFGARLAQLVRRTP